MKLGVCGGPDRIKTAAEAGYDYIELSFKYIALCSEEEYNSIKNELAKYSLPAETANCFFPGEIKLVGNEKDEDKIKQYLSIGFKRAEGLGIKIVVLGSGGARSAPDGYSFGQTANDLFVITRDIISPMAAEHGITVVFEPLCKEEASMLNTVKEGAMFAGAINKENIGTLADIYHMYRENDSNDDIRDVKGILMHAHISNPVSPDKNMKRCYMKSPDEYDYKAFMDALKYIGCERVSIEANTDDFDSDAYDAIKILRMYN